MAPIGNVNGNANPMPDGGVVGPSTPIDFINTTSSNVSTNHP